MEDKVKLEVSLSQDDFQLLHRAFFKEKGLVRQHLDSYNEFVEKGLQDRDVRDQGFAAGRGHRHNNAIALQHRPERLFLRRV